MELLGSISVHERCCQPAEEGPGAVSRVPHVYLSWVSHNRGRLRLGTAGDIALHGNIRDTEVLFSR